MSRRRASLDSLQRLNALEKDVHRGLTAEAARDRRTAEDEHATRRGALEALSVRQREALGPDAIIDCARIETLSVAADSAVRHAEAARDRMTRSVMAHDAAIDALAQAHRSAEATTRRVERKAREETVVAERRADHDLMDSLRKGKPGD